MEVYKKFEVKNKDTKYTYDNNFQVNNLCNINNVQEENEKKFDTLLDGILLNSTAIKNRNKLN